MKILSIDTASEICGVSILEDTNLICQLDTITNHTHSQNLMPIIEQAFKQTGLHLKDIDLLVCDKGPGSFTGIRIGIATIKAFHDSLSIPCLGVTSLEALAYCVKTNGLIASILDCKNGNCYFALYNSNNSILTELISPTADTIINALEILKPYISNSTNITIVGDGAISYRNLILDELKNVKFSAPENNMLNSYQLGLLGLQKWHNNKSEDILPLYLKKPQAQKILEEKCKDITISTMTLNDFNQISSILQSEFDSFWEPLVLKDELNSKNSKYIVAKCNNEIVGFAGIKIMIDEADIMNIVVKKDYRNQGIGSLLLTKLISLSKKLNLTSLSLEVMEENYPALHLYKKFGFKKIGMRKNYYKGKNGIILNFDIG